MKKILLCITLLLSFFMTPIKADTYENNPYMYVVSDAYDVINDVLMPDLNMYVYIEPQYNGLLYYDTVNGYIINKSDDVVTGIGSFGEQSAIVSCDSGDHVWKAWYDTVGGVELAEIQNRIIVIRTGNDFEWWYPSNGDVISVDLTTIHNYMLVICLLLFMNFLRGR